jgi:hypothetical protein
MNMRYRGNCIVALTLASLLVGANTVEARGGRGGGGHGGGRPSMGHVGGGGGRGAMGHANAGMARPQARPQPQISRLFAPQR